MKSVFLLFLWLSTAVISQAADEPKRLDTALGETYGFIKGQKATLAQIAHRTPELAAKVAQVELEFSASFGKAEKKIESAVRKMLGPDFDRTMVIEAINRRDYSETEHTANDRFIDLVGKRAKGELPLLVLETLLIYQYQDRPAEEFEKGYTRDITLDARSVTVQLRHPVSWPGQSSDQAGVIHKFVSESGRGLESCTLMIRDIPGLAPNASVTDEESRELASPAGLSAYIPTDAENTEVRQIELKGVGPAGRIVYEISPTVIDGGQTTMKYARFVVPARRKVLVLEFEVTVAPGKDAEVQKRYTLLEPLFKMIADSITVSE